MKYLITGGAGFIGSALIRQLIHETDHHVVNLDKLTYAGSLLSLTQIETSDRYRFVHGDICDRTLVQELLATERPDKIIHLAAESHVDRSVDEPGVFIQTNIVGTYTLLDLSLGYWNSLDGEPRNEFRFHHVSTDEVYGSLPAEGLFREESPYRPNSPYSASKASSDHLVRAWHKTYGLPVVVTNCSNNYGPYQFPEKLIPMMILNALDGRALPVYGDGAQVRDWLFVEDHARALLLAANHGTPGETYNVGGHNEQRNIEVVEMVCALINELQSGGAEELQQLRSLITYVQDRPGHDRRYAIDAGKIERDFGWTPRESFASGLRATVAWYLENRDWCSAIEARTSGRERLGLGG